MSAANKGSARQRFTNATRSTGGLEMPESGRLNALQDENAKLKKLL
jgi:hypothetical protein